MAELPCGWKRLIVSGNLGALDMRSVRREPLDVHVVEDPALDRLQPVPRIRQRARHDDGHGVLQEGALHLLLDLDGFDGAKASGRLTTITIAAITRSVAGRGQGVAHMSRNLT